MKPPETCILTINGGSSSIKFAVYQAGDPLKRRLHGKLDRIGLSGTNLTFDDPAANRPESRTLDASDHKSAATFLIDWLDGQHGFESVRAVGHRVVHGMQHTAPELVTQALLDELHRISPYDPDHLPNEIELIENAPRHRLEAVLQPIVIPRLTQVSIGWHHLLGRHRCKPALQRRCAIPEQRATADAMDAYRANVFARFEIVVATQHVEDP